MFVSMQNISRLTKNLIDFIHSFLRLATPTAVWSSLSLSWPKAYQLTSIRSFTTKPATRRYFRCLRTSRVRVNYPKFLVKTPKLYSPRGSICLSILAMFYFSVSPVDEANFLMVWNGYTHWKTNKLFVHLHKLKCKGHNIYGFVYHCRFLLLWISLQVTINWLKIQELM